MRPTSVDANLQVLDIFNYRHYRRRRRFGWRNGKTIGSLAESKLGLLVVSKEWRVSGATDLGIGVRGRWVLLIADNAKDLVRN